jgi:hypothetical protein
MNSQEISMKKIIFVFLAAVLAACSLNSGTELSQYQDKWRDAGISSYRFNLFIGCFCPFADKMPLSVEVHDGAVVSLTYPDGNPSTRRG